VWFLLFFSAYVMWLIHSSHSYRKLQKSAAIKHLLFPDPKIAMQQLCIFCYVPYVYCFHAPDTGEFVSYSEYCRKLHAYYTLFAVQLCVKIVCLKNCLIKLVWNVSFVPFNNTGMALCVCWCASHSLTAEFVVTLLHCHIIYSCIHSCIFMSILTSNLLTNVHCVL